jgi:hypothetical protein
LAARGRGRGQIKPALIYATSHVLRNRPPRRSALSREAVQECQTVAIKAAEGPLLDLSGDHATQQALAQACRRFAPSTRHETQLKPLFALDETIFTSTCALQLNWQGLKRRPKGSGCTHAKRPLVVVQLEALTMNEYSFEAKHGAVLRVKFVLVSGRTPRPQSSCALCCEPIGDSYLREIATRLSYCGHKCYVDHCKVPVRALQNHARAS